ncbi:MAG: biotin-dependent carboxyltransferase family protein [Burkholderiaceae bacterium]
MIEIVSTRALNTVQDLGRFGHRGEGVCVAGAMDRLALSAGNRLLGNDPGAAAIEVTMFPFVVRFLRDARFALTGAHCEATLDGAAVLPWWATRADAGATLTVGAPLEGAIACLVVEGGIGVEPRLGSRSTDLKIGFGGFEGRTLRKGDRIPLGPAGTARSARPGGWGIDPARLALPPVPAAGETTRTTAVRVMPAGEYEKFPEPARERFWGAQWSIGANSNRSAFRLSGPRLQAQGHGDVMYTHGIVPGIVQVPPSGQPIVQMADANTHGGYPKIGTVIEADRWRLAQARPGGALRFVPATRDEALAALAAERAWLGSISDAVERERSAAP